MIHEYKTMSVFGTPKDRTDRVETLDRQLGFDDWTRVGMDVTNEQTALWYRRVHKEDRKTPPS